MRIIQWPGLALLFILVGFVALHAQETSEREAVGQIMYATGEGFQVVGIRGEEEFDLASDTVEGLYFYPGDYINTYNGTFLEVQLNESSDILKISENTSFRFEDNLQEKESSFEIRYGRVRARVKKMAGVEKFSIRSPSAIAGVRGTDFGYDVLYQTEENRAVAAIYCFDGEVAVTPMVAISSSSGIDPVEAESLQRQETTAVLVNAGEMIKLEEQDFSTEEGAEDTGPHFALVKTEVDAAITDFWERNDFHSLQKEEEAGPEPQIMEEEPVEAPQIFTKQNLLRGAAVTGGIGTVFGLAALTFLYADPLVGNIDQATRENLAQSLGIAASPFLATSLASLIAALF